MLQSEMTIACINPPWQKHRTVLLSVAFTHWDSMYVAQILGSMLVKTS